MCEGSCSADVVEGRARWHVAHCDNLFALQGMPDGCVDAVVCDPPYELAFMGRRWDASGVAYDVERWREVLRVLKPGGHLLAFGGTRTYHRMTCAIEDAGFDIRDSLHWMYASGFPKSLDVSKAIDAAAGAEREVVGPNPTWREAKRANAIMDPVRGGSAEVITAPATDAARQWSGWGTALKPAHETVVVAQKPLDLPGLVATIGSCLSALRASIARDSSQSSQSGSVAVCASAPRSVAPPLVTPDASSGPMGTSPCASATDSSLSIVSSWLDILVALSGLVSTSIIATDASLITDLRTLNSLASQLTPARMHRAAMRSDGSTSLVELADALFSGVASKCNAIRIRSAIESATGLDLDACLDGDADSHRPIVVARKPLNGTVAANVLEHGTGAINVAGCRVACGDVLTAPRSDPGNRSGVVGIALQATGGAERNHSAQAASVARTMELGRWPANILFSHAPSCDPAFCDPACPVAELDRQSGDRPGMSGGGNHRPDYAGGMFGGIDCSHTVRGDNGGASRFFPVFRFEPKASTSEREAGLDHLPMRTAGELTGREDGSDGLKSPRAGAGRSSNGRRNVHPTVKPVALMRWLCKLVTPPGGIVLDIYAGSGTTGIGAVLEGFRFVGIEGEAMCGGFGEERSPHVEIARARIRHRIGGTYDIKRDEPANDAAPRQGSLFG